MKGLLNIYIEKNTKDISILILHVTSIGFSRGIGSIIENIDIKSLKERVFRYLMLSLENYKYDKEEFADPFKKTKYKTWNRFFDMHYLIEVIYREELKEYEIAMPERDRRTKSFGNNVNGFEFKIKKEEFDSKFDDVIKKIMDNLEKYQS